MPKKKASEPGVEEPKAGVSVEPPVSEPVAASPSVSPDAASVRSGELASAIANLAKVVDGEKTDDVPEVAPKEVVIEPEKTVEPTAETPAPGVVQAEPETVAETPVEAGAGEEKAKANGGRGGGMWVVLAFGLGLLLGMVLGYVIWGQSVVPVSVKTDESVTESETMTEPTPEVTPAETEEVNKGELKILVLNGTGGKGVAAAGRDYLESLGYKDVGVGNADTEDFEVTEVAVKEGQAKVFEMVKADVGAKYEVADEATVLEKDSEYDVVVTIGAK